MKVMTIIGTRPEIIKLSLTIQEIDKYFDHIIVHTGQNYDYELNTVFFQDFGLRQPDYFLDCAGKCAAETIANVIVRSDEIMSEVQPDALLIYGDTNSCLSVISAKRRKIPVFHMEAGNRCFDQRVPEEVNRKIVDHLSDINLVITEHARQYLIREGIKPETIIKTGSTMKEIYTKFANRIDRSPILMHLGLKPNDFFLVSSHREENVDSQHNLVRIVNILNDLAESYNLPIIVSTHPRTRKNLDILSIRVNDLVQFNKPFGFFDYVNLQLNAKCVLSDSGTITEESSLLGFPAVTIRETHERPEGMDETAILMAGLNLVTVRKAVAMAIQHKKLEAIKIVKDYDVDNVSVKIPRLILSYTEYINRNVWHSNKPSQ